MDEAVTPTRTGMDEVVTPTYVHTGMDEVVTPTYVRNLLITWCVVTALLCLLGNCIVLLASRKFKAIKLDDFSVTLIDNLAAADIGYTLVGVMPTIGAIIEQKWIYGRAMCIVNKFLTNVFFNMTILLVALLNISKLSCLMYPLYTPLRTKSNAIIITSTLWASFITYSLFSTLVSDPDVYFDTVSFQCWVNFGARIPFGTILVGWMIFTDLVIVVTTVWLLVLVKKITEGTILSTGGIAVITVSTIFSIANLPAAIVMAMKMTAIMWDPVAEAACNIFATYIYYLSNFSNPIIYYFSIKSFRLFIDRKVAHFPSSLYISDPTRVHQQRGAVVEPGLIEVKRDTTYLASRRYAVVNMPTSRYNTDRVRVPQLRDAIVEPGLRNVRRYTI